MTDSITSTTNREPSAFDAALADYMKTRAVLNELPAHIGGDEERRLMDAQGVAEDRLFRQPPKSIADIRALAEIAWQDPASLPTSDMIATVLKGLRSLDGNAPSRTFDAKWWLYSFERFGGGYVVRGDEVLIVTPIPQSEALIGLLWELETRGGREQVKAAIREREAAKANPKGWRELRERVEAEDARLRANDQTSQVAAFGTPECEAAEARTAQIVESYDAAVDAIMRFPAPNPEALRYKLAILATERFTIGHDDNAADFARQVKADADALLAGA